MGRYTSEDVSLWEEDNQWELDTLEPKVGDLNSQPTQDHVVSVLSNTYVYVAFCQIAKGEYWAAKGALAKACEMVKRLYELADLGFPLKPNTLRTGYFQHLLYAHAAGDSNLALALSRYLKIEHGGPEDSNYFCGILKALVEGRQEEAEELLETPVPVVDKQYVGYADCLAAIVRRESGAFADALATATDAWERHATRVFKDQPDVVCFLGGVGFVNLATSIGMKIIFSDERIPKGMLV